MELARTIADFQLARKKLQADSSRLVFVPTMGGLHDGHLSLVRRAKTVGDICAVSIYVNPLQFGEGEDFADYPRDLRGDCEKLEGRADIVFAPDDSQLSPQTQTVCINLPPLGDELCGKTRPHFFGGVATVTTKLFNIVKPDVAVFGKKDYQQAYLINHLVRQLNFAIEIVLSPTVREDDGLAMSSRNVYLSAALRQRAARLFQTLQAARRLLLAGKTAAAVCAQSVEKLNDDGFAVDYFELRDADSLSVLPRDFSPLKSARRRTILLAAAKLGDVRLIDNIEV